MPSLPLTLPGMFHGLLKSAAAQESHQAKCEKFSGSSVWHYEVALLFCLAVFRPTGCCNWREYFRIVVFRIFRRIRNVPGFHLIRRRRFQHGHDLFRLREVRIQPGFFQFPRQLHRLPVVASAGRLPSSTKPKPCAFWITKRLTSSISSLPKAA